MARQGHSTARNARWRRVVSCALAYALALLGFIIAENAGAAASVAVSGADGWILAGFELCAHGAAATLPDTPQQIPAGDDHCPFCISGLLCVNCAPPRAPHRAAVATIGAPWPLAASRLVTVFINKSAWPRGPPLAA
jgi:hypothetical protein